MHIAMITGALSPYHLARVTHANAVIEAKGWSFTLIERVGHQDEYPWFGSTGEHVTVRRAYDSSDPTPTDRKSAIQLLAVLEELNPDCVVFGRSSSAYYAVLDWCLRRDKATVQMSDSTYLDYKRYKIKELIKSRVTKLYSSGFAAGTRAKEYLASLGMREEQITIGYDVVDNEHFAKGSDSAREAQQRINSDDGLPAHYFLMTSRFVEKKNIFHVLTAFAKYIESNANPLWNLVLIGDGPLKYQIRRQISELNLESRVKLVGYKSYEELPRYYGLAEVFILASTSDQWGLVVNEALAAGTPVLVSDRCGCAPDLVIDGKSGFTFNPHDDCELSSLMTKVSSTECDRQKMGEEGKKVVAQWGLDRFANGVCKSAEIAVNTRKLEYNALDRLLLWLLSPK